MGKAPLFSSYNNKKTTIIVANHDEADAQAIIYKLRVKKGIKINNTGQLFRFLMNHYVEKEGL